MRHNNSGKKLSRTPSHRKALFRNLAKALLTHGKIRTTEIKAKALRRVVDPLITLALRNDLHSRRLAYRVLGNHQLVKRLFDEIGPAFAGVPGGFTRVTKLALPRKGDCAAMAIIELTHGAPVVADAKPVKKEAATQAAAVDTTDAAPKSEAKKAAKPKAAPKAKADKGTADGATKPKAASKPRAKKAAEEVVDVTAEEK